MANDLNLSVALKLLDEIALMHHADSIAICASQGEGMTTAPFDNLMERVELLLVRAAAPPSVQGVPSDAARDVLAERQRQKDVEGWTVEHDDKYNGCELAAAAATYAVCVDPVQLKVCGVTAWPWPSHWWKPSGYRRNLIKAGALLLAEIERIDRAAPAPGSSK